MTGVFVSDIRLAFRTFLKQPGFTATAVLVMAVGISGVTVMFSTLEAVVLRPLPFPEPDRLAWVWSLTPAHEQNTVSAVDYLDYRAGCEVFEPLASYYALPANAVLTGRGEPERVPETLVSHNFFRALGVRPAAGRFFLPAEEAPAAPDVVVLGHALWQRRFGGRPDVVGTSLTLDGRVFEIVGVTPAGFDFPKGIELWRPMRDDDSAAQGRGNRNFRMFGRLAPGATIESAQARTSAVASQIAQAYPADDKGWDVQVQSMHEVFYGSYRPAMLALLGAVTLLLLVACANVSSLVLARAVAKRHEIAVRLSLGASRRRIVAQQVVEGVAVAVLGGAFGLLLSGLGIEALKALAPPTLPRVADIGVNRSVAGVALAASVASGLLLGLVPAVRSGAIPLADTLRQGARATEERAGLRLRGALVVAQVALSAALLVAAGLLARSLVRLYEVDPGFRPEALLLTEVQLPDNRYGTPGKRAAFVSDVRERLLALPDVVDAAGAELMPFTLSGRWNTVWRSDRPPRSPEERMGAQRQIVTRGYFQTLGIPIFRGRDFGPADGIAVSFGGGEGASLRTAVPPVTVVNQTLAERFWPGEDALGRTLVLAWGNGIPLEVVGIVADVRQRGPDDTPRPTFYVSYEQFPVMSDLKLLVRARGETTAIAGGVRDVFGRMDPTLALARFNTMTSLFAERVALPRFRAWLLSIFSAVALVLAVTGLYGVLACFVTDRTHELGIRMALGADSGTVTWLVVRRGLALAATGLVLGLAGGVAGARVAQDLLYETAPLDPAILAAVAAALALAALAACLVPARRATRVDPVEALRVS
jgi:putative ABC transport system permease protein